jgi:hypothetical protein
MVASTVQMVGEGVNVSREVKSRKRKKGREALGGEGRESRRSKLGLKANL